MLFRTTGAIEPISSGPPIVVSQNLLVSTLDDDVVVTDLSTGLRKHLIRSDGESPSALAVSPDLNMLLIASHSLQIHIYSLETGERLKTFSKAHESVISVLAIDSTSTLAASGGAEGAVKVWDLRSFVLTHRLRGHGGIVNSLAFWSKLGDPNWKLASGSDDTTVRVWDLTTGKCAYSLTNHVASVRGVVWTSNGSVLLSAGRDRIVSLWSGKDLQHTLNVEAEVESIGLILGKYIWTASPAFVKLWDLSGDVVSQWSLPHDEAEITTVYTVGENLFSILSDQTIVVLSGETLEPVQYLTTNHSEVIDLQPVDQGLALATNSQDIRIANINKPLEFLPLVGHSDIVIAIDVLGPWLISASKDKTARLWDTRTSECKAVFSGHTGAIGAVALSRSGSLPKFVLTGSEDLTIKRWGADGNATYTRKAHDKDINALDVSKDDKYFATGSQDRTAKVFSTDSGECLGILRGHRRGVWSVKFSPGNQLVSGSGDKTVRLWSLHDFSCQRTFEGHLNSVLKVLAAPTYIASAGGDGLVKIWDKQSSECTATLDGHVDKVWALTQGKDGSIISGGGDGAVKVWEDCTVEEQERQDEQHSEQVEKEQELENRIRAEEWEKAITLALELKHPMRLLNLLKSVTQKQEPGSISGLKSVDDVIASLDQEHSLKLIERVRDWNTNSRTSLVAQRVLNVMLARRDPQEIPHDKIKALLAYSERHYGRINEVLSASYALDYVLTEMSLTQ